MWTRIKDFWRRNKARYTEAVNRYGFPVVLTAVAFNLLMIGTVVAMVKVWGWEFESFNMELGLIGGAWLVTRPLMPVRWILAVLIAPPLVRAWRKMRGMDPNLPPALQGETLDGEE
ncbi:MAG: hypothetical protein ACI9MC_002334 [Kiritimatiellia bacterium]|jgi:hypothetical protein